MLKNKKLKYDIPHTSAAELENIIDYLLTMKKGKVLDIPSGNLWLTKILAKHLFDCTADDICYQEMTEEMGELIKKLKIKHNSSNLDERLPYNNESFDYIVCFTGLEHIANPYLAIKEFRRILKDKGKIFITVPNALCMTSRLRFLLNGEFSAFRHVFDLDYEYRHLHINPLFISLFHYVCSEIGLEMVLIKPFGKLGFWHQVMTSVFIPFLIIIQRYLKRKYKKTRLTNLLNSRALLLNQSLFIVFEKKEVTKDKICVGDYGKYPSIGIS
jgi:ubiquinone/menaquinone biosynthesis C-methylase UbiE